MDVNIIIVGIISGVALILGIKNWSRNNRQIEEHCNRLKEEINILKEDFEKQINALIEDVKELKTTKEPENPPVNNGEISTEEDICEILGPITDSLTYFKIAENWYRQRKIIEVNFKEGIHQEKTYVYDHDYVYDKVIHIYQKLPAWQNYGNFTNNNNIPGNVSEYVSEI